MLEYTLHSRHWSKTVAKVATLVLGWQGYGGGCMDEGGVCEGERHVQLFEKTDPRGPRAEASGQDRPVCSAFGTTRSLPVPVRD